MTHAEVLSRFEEMIEAPEAVSRLKAFIVDLAIRGRIVEQDFTQISASQWLADVLRDKRPNEHLEQFNEMPYQIPKNWAWIPFCQVVEGMANGIYKPEGFYADDGVLCLRMYNIKDGQINFDKPKRIRTTVEERESYELRRGDILVNRVNSKELVGKAAVIPIHSEPLIFESKNIRVRLVETETLPFFVNLLFRSSLYRAIIRDYAKQACGQATINQSQLATLPLPLPPLEEQQRIVAKVSLLFEMCSRLADSQKEREQRRDRLVAASLHALTDGQSEDRSATSLQDSARFYFSHLPRLVLRVDHVVKLRSTVLDLAARGRLVPQCATDEPVKNTLRKISARLEKLGSSPSQTKTDLSKQPEFLFTIPSTWSWVSLGEIALSVCYGTSHKSEVLEDGVPVLAMGHIKDGSVDLNTEKKVPDDIEDLPALYLKRYDLLYNRTNSAELVGKTGIFLGEDDQYTFASYLIRMRFALDLVNPAYINIAMNAPYFRPTQIVPHLKQQCGQANVNGTKLKTMMIPFPPFEEQNRIVNKVKELMKVCAELEAQIGNTSRIRSSLLEAALHDALSASRLERAHA
ncbi:MAG TPA: restriction endonuclease subunit S [Terriglobales bacterium]|nr:restriction endonuclease subunit S [Terriglobales bacterium]